MQNLQKASSFLADFFLSEEKNIAHYFFLEKISQKLILVIFFLLLSEQYGNTKLMIN